LRGINLSYPAKVNIAAQESKGRAVTDPNAEAQIFRSETRVVEVAVVARDANDMPVVDLRSCDLRVFDNGVEQSILSFDRLDGAAPPAGGNGASGPAGDGGAVRAPRLSIILLDALNTSPSNQVHGREAISEMLGNMPQGEDRIAILALGENLHLIHPFSPYRASLRETVDGYEGELPASGVVDPLDPWNPDPDSDPFLGERRLTITLNALLEIAGEMKDVPGEKSLLWITSGFPPPDDHQSIADGTRALAAARVMLYPVDARGLFTCPPKLCALLNAHIATMEEMAEQTGGRAFTTEMTLRRLRERRWTIRAKATCSLTRRAVTSRMGRRTSSSSELPGKAYICVIGRGISPIPSQNRHIEGLDCRRRPRAHLTNTNGARRGGKAGLGRAICAERAVVTKKRASMETCPEQPSGTLIP
jgi:VWFA-related protein